MPRAFLSHSSKDKEFVKNVIQKLRQTDIIYDKFSFEAGEKTLEEILNGLNKSDLFILFISEAALKSDWVKREIKEAKDLKDNNVINKLYPIIIDENIKHDDKSIPHWLQENYNLKFIARSNIVARLIRQKLKELSWSKHPVLEERKSIFVGRNDLINEFEQRIDDYEKDLPIVIFASGLPNIGRKSLMKHCLIKSNVVLKESFDPPVILIDSHESIEDFILKCYDLGITSEIDTENLLEKSIDEKARLARNLINDIQAANEIVFIEDTGGIILPGGHIAEWFLKILNIGGLKRDKIALSIASRFHTNRGFLEKYGEIYYMEVPELSRRERKGLFKRYSEVIGLNLRKDDLKYFSKYLSGYPQHAYFTANHIKKNGIPYAKKNIDLIKEYNNDHVSTLLSDFENNDDALELLRLLSEFDFISYDFLVDLHEDETKCINYIDQFINQGICELFGRNKEYIRIIDAVRNYILRGNESLPNRYDKKLKQHVNEWVQNDDLHVDDISNFFISIKEALNNGYKIPKRYLIPSHYLKSMIDKYQNDRDYDGVIDLAQNILENKENLDEFILREIKYWLCLSLARIRSEKFLQEVQFFYGTREYDFLLGFYYRRVSRYSDAISSFEKTLEEHPNFHRAKHELVQSYMDKQEYGQALEYAKENYIHNSNNPLHIQSYFVCILNTNKKFDDKTKQTLKKLIDDLEKIKTNKGKEIALTTKSLFYQKVKDNPQKALEFAEQGIKQFPKSPYPYIQKFEVLKQQGKTEQMEETVESIKDIVGKNSTLYIMRKASLEALNGNIYDAKLLIEDISNLPHSRKQNIFDDLYELERKNNNNE